MIPASPKISAGPCSEQRPHSAYEVPLWKNAHHITEALFKSLGAAVKEAVQITGTGVTSTKGVL